MNTLFVEINKFVPTLEKKNLKMKQLLTILVVADNNKEITNLKA